MKKNIPILLFCILIAFLNYQSINAQISDFNLSDYKLADYTRQGIDLNFQFYGNTNSLKQNDSTFYSSNSITENIDALYFYTKYNRKYFNYFLIELQSYGNNENMKSDTINKYNYQNLESSLWVLSENRLYSKKQFFLDLGTSFQFKFSNYNMNSKSYNSGNWSDFGKIDENIYEYHIKPKIGVGKGRIERVEDARQALYILETLKKANKLNHEPSQEEILLLASRITELKNERKLDSRLHKIYELEQLDSLLSSSDLLSEKDIAYFSRLNDMWDFGGLQQRNSGIEAGIFYTPSFIFRRINDKSNFDTTYKNNLYNHFLSFTLKWEKPINQKFQSSLYVEMSLRHSKDDLFNSSSKIVKSIIPTFSYHFGYFPNTRKSIVAGVNATSYRNNEETNFDEGNNPVSENVSITELKPELSLNYYFSPKLRLEIDFLSNLIWKKNSKYENEKIYETINKFNISLLYSIF